MAQLTLPTNSTIDKAAAHGALHKNTAARKKSQAQRLVSS